MEAKKIDNSDVTLKIYELDSLLIAEYRGTQILGITDYSIVSSMNADVEVMLRFKMKSPPLVTHEIVARLGDQTL